MKHTEKTKKLISKNNAKYWLGKKIPEEIIKKGVITRSKMKYKPRDEKARKNMKKAWVKMKKQGFKPSMLGRKHSEETKKKMSLARIGKDIGKYRGEKSPAWKGGVTPINQIIRTSTEYKQWRKAVFEKDNYVCKLCGQRGGKLCAHHIKPFSIFIELRFDIQNGNTLCKECHKKTDTYAGKLRKKYGKN